MSDAKIAAIGRNLAEALAESAYERSDEAKKRVAILQTELCEAARKEKEEPDVV